MKKYLLAWCFVAWSLSAAGTNLTQVSRTNDAPVRDLILFTGKYTNIEPFTAGPYDGNIAQITVRVLQQMHYSRQSFTKETARHFLQRYLETLDPQHFHFVRGDIAEFDRFADRLDELTLRQGDTSPANIIFARFTQRVEERVRYAAALLEKNDFRFDTDDRYTANRKDLGWPDDPAAAQQLWGQHLRYEYLQEKLNKQKPEDILKTLANRYRRLLRSLGEFDSDEVLQLYLTALSHVYDPHSDYMGKSQLENFAISMKLSLFGIGALLRSEDGYCVVHELVAGGPAAKSKRLKPNDKIIAVQQAGKEPVDIVDMKLNKVVEMIRGPKSSEVTLTIIPADAADQSVRRQITLVRDEIKLEDAEAKAKIVDLPEQAGRAVRVGVIDLPSFYASMDFGANKTKGPPKSTTDDVSRLIRKLKAEGVSGIVLDLRRNGGGSLEEAIRLTGLFVREGPIVQVRDATDDVTVESDPDPGILYDGPLVVLTSRFSASASEILAAALQDYGRALIVGDVSTHGKGTVQTILELGKYMRQRLPSNFNPGALKLTIRKFYRATGSSTQLKGVTPDIVLPSVSNYLEVGESSQEYALPWDTIPSAKFERLDLVQPYLDELKRRSAARQAEDPEFGYVREDIETYRKHLADKSISLNEEQRRKEKTESEERTKKRKQDRLARGESKAVAYEITLKNVSQPGLPEPMAKTNDAPAKLEGDAPVNPETAEADAEEKMPVVDVNLDEAKRILVDLILLGNAERKPIAARPSALRKID